VLRKGEWKMDEIVRVVRLDFSQLPEFEQEEDGSIQRDKFADIVIPKLMEQIRGKMAESGTKFQLYCRLV
jgi:hypothetical protein